MVIFLYGPDDYRREEKKRWYIKEFEKKHSGLSVRTFDFADSAQSAAADQLEEFKGFARAQSIFESKKLAILENIYPHTKRGYAPAAQNSENPRYGVGVYETDEEKLAEVLRDVVAKKATTILCSEKEKPPKGLGFLLEEPVRHGSPLAVSRVEPQAATVHKFDYLTGYEWEMFMRERAKKLGLEFSDFAFKFLAAVYQNNTWGLVTELEKIRSLKSGSTSLTAGSVIDKKDLAGLDLEIAPDYWSLFDGLKSRDLQNRLAALEKLFAIGDPPPKIFNILASSWREKIPQMAEYDLKVKSGKLDYEEVLLDLVIG